MNVKRGMIALLGISAIVVTIWLYFESIERGGIFILLFGLSSAVVLQAGVALIGYAVRYKKEEQLARLAKIPEIDTLIGKAMTAEQKLELLRTEYTKLETSIREETERLFFAARKVEISKEAVRLIYEYEAIESHLVRLGKMPDSPVSQEIHRLRAIVKARMEGAFVLSFRGRQVILRGTSSGMDPYEIPAAVLFSGLAEILHATKRAFVRRHVRPKTPEAQSSLMESAAPALDFELKP